MKKFSKIRRQAFLLLSVLLLLPLLAEGCASRTGEARKVPTSTPAQPVTVGAKQLAARNPIASRTTMDTFTIGDLVVVNFAGTADQIPPHEEHIKEDGTITLPLIGVIKAAGKTSRDLQNEIHDCYVPKYYKRLSVTVDLGLGTFFVRGQVHRPGRQICFGQTTVLKAIQVAGGFTEFAARQRVQLTRTDGRAFLIDCVMAEVDPSLDLPVNSGDRIEVPFGVPRDIYHR